MEVIDSVPCPLCVGDEVWYLPHSCHAFSEGSDGSFPYVVGEKVGDSVREMNRSELRDRLKVAKRSSQKVNDQKVSRLVLVRPDKPWHGVVRSVNNDGTVDLDIASNRSGITLHYNGVRVTNEDSTHTCRRKQ